MSEVENHQLPSHKFLDDLKIPYEKRIFPNTTEKGAQNVAHVLHFSERQAVKTLIFEILHKDKSQYALVMLGGDQNAVSGLLKKALGSRNIKLATPEKVIEITGYKIGSIPPFHWQPEGFLTIIEKSLMDEEILGVGAGVWGNEIMIKPDELVKASSAKIVNLTVKPVD